MLVIFWWRSHVNLIVSCKSHSLSLLWEFVLLQITESTENPSLFLILQPTIYSNTCHFFFSRVQWRMLWKHCSKLFLVQENFEHNTWYCWEWQVTVVAHFVLSSLLGNCLSLHHPRNWNHREGMERAEKWLSHSLKSCPPDTEFLPQGKPSPFTTLALFSVLLVQQTEKSSTSGLKWCFSPFPLQTLLSYQPPLTKL